VDLGPDKPKPHFKKGLYGNSKLQIPNYKKSRIEESAYLAEKKTLMMYN
jgi:hypothetical protein